MSGKQANKASGLFNVVCFIMHFQAFCCALTEYILHWRRPPCFRRAWRIAAVLRGVQAAGVALCCGNNNGGACATGSFHPLAPNVAPSSPRLLSCPAKLSKKKKTSLVSPFIHSVPSVSPIFQLQLFIIFFFSPSALLSSVYFSSSISSQFHPFFCPHKDSHSPGALRGEQKPPLHRNATAVGIAALRFSLASYFVFSHSLRGHCFPSPLCGRGLDGGVEGELLARCPVGEDGDGVLKMV